jgi:hypothetical protein
MEPVKHWQFGDAGVGENAPETRTTVGKRGHRRDLRAPNGVEFAADQRFDSRICFRDGAENLPTTSLRLDIARAGLYCRDQLG